MLDDGELSTDGAPARARSLRDWVVDFIVIVGSLGLGVIVLEATWHKHGTLIAILDAGVGVAACLSLWVRRTRPLSVAFFALSVSLFSAMAAGATLVALFNVAVRCRLRTLAAISAFSVVPTLIYCALYADGGYDFSGLLISLLLTGVAIGWGLFARARRQLVMSLHDRARRLESEQRLRVDQARLAERARIAREMHDVLAHRISLLSVHAGALEFRPDAPPEEIARAAGVIRASAHAAMEELREVIGLLREPNGEHGRDGNGSQPVPERPQPTLGQVRELVEESRQAGTEVRFSLEVDEPGAVPDAIGRTAYRIVQEGLTNARKHAPGSLVDVEIATDPAGALTVSVVSRPRVGEATSPAPTPPLPGAGTGLIGLTERVSLAGGRLAHGPTPNGGYSLHATLLQPA